jgi:hypothetical protein
MHTVIENTPEFRPLDVSVVSGYIKYLEGFFKSANEIKLTRFTLPGQNGVEAEMFCAQNEIMSMYTAVSKAKFERIEETLSGTEIAKIEIDDFSILERFKRLSDRLMIPLIGQEEPQATLAFSEKECKISIQDIGNRLSEDKIMVHLDEGSDCSATINFMVFRDILLRASVVPLQIHVKDACLIITYKETTEILFKYL